MARMRAVPRLSGINHLWVPDISRHPPDRGNPRADTDPAGLATADAQALDNVVSVIGPALNQFAASPRPGCGVIRQRQIGHRSAGDIRKTMLKGKLQFPRGRPAESASPPRPPPRGHLPT